jgi:hypothetical protein
VNLPSFHKTPLSTPLFQFSSPNNIILTKPLISNVNNVKVVTSNIIVPILKFQQPIDIYVKTPLDALKLPKTREIQLILPAFIFTHAPNVAIAETHIECKLNIRHEHLIEAPSMQKVSEGIIDVAEALKKQGVENPLELLVKWENDAEKLGFFNAMLWPRLMCVFLVPAPFKKRSPGELVIRKILATEYKRAYKDIEASHDAPCELSEKSKHVITFTTIEVEKLVSSQLNKKELEKCLEDLMSQAGIYGEEIKLVIFCSPTENIEPLFRVVRNRLTSCFKLIAKYGEEIPKEDFKQIIRSLAWMLSIDKSVNDLLFAERYNDIDEAFGFLDKRRIYFLTKLKQDEDWIHIRKWEGESYEHSILKLLVYKTIKKDYNYKDADIEVEKPCKPKDDVLTTPLVPDVHVEGKIWAEVETLRGMHDPLDLIQEFQDKAEEISRYEEFWLILPSFEIMMHIYQLRPLLEQLFKLFHERVKVSIWYPDLVNARICKLLEKCP